MRVIEFLRYLKTQFTVGYKLGTKSKDNPKLFTEKDILFIVDGTPVLYYPELLIGAGVAFSAIGALSTTLKGCIGTGAIFVDDNFLNVPPHIKKIFIYHELGHSALNHAELIQNSLEYNSERRISYRVPQFEIDADNYAADKVGSPIAIEALAFVLDSFEGCDAVEITQRIDILRNRIS